MSAAREVLAKCVQSALDAALADPAAREALARPLAEATTLARSGPPPVIATSLAAASQAALMGLAEGSVTGEIAALVAEALNACFSCAAPASRLASARMRTSSDSLLVASRGAPAVRPVVGSLPAEEDASVSTGEGDSDGSDVEEEEEQSFDNEARPMHDDAPALSADRRMPVSAPPPARLDEEAAAPTPVAKYHAAIIDDAADTLSMLARHAAERPMRERPAGEQRMLALTDAIAVIGAQAIPHLRSFFRASRESPDPWRGFAPIFALGALDGDMGLSVIPAEIARLSPGDHARGRAVAEALALAPHPAIPELAEDLTMSAHPVARAVGIDVLAQRGLLSPDVLRWHLFDTNVPVLLAAIRAGRACDPTPEWLAPIVVRWMHHPDAEVAWAAAHSAALLGRADPWLEVQGGGRIVRVLGARVAELFVLFGEAADVPLLDRLLEQEPISRALLSRVARFGHPRSWAFLVHCLGEEEFADDAAEALSTLFGPCVERADLLRGPAWRNAIAEARLDEALRYRRGTPWTPGAIASEITSGELSRAEVELRLDELSVRLAAPQTVNLSRFSGERDNALAAALAALARKGRDITAGSWDCRTVPTLLRGRR